MITRSADKTVEVSEHKMGGPGKMIAEKLITENSQLYNKGRLFNRIILNKECGIGYHVHENEEEIYFILSGKGEYNDNGTITTVEPGDVTFCFSGEGHGITNHDEEPLTLMALILYK